MEDKRVGKHMVKGRQLCERSMRSWERSTGHENGAVWAWEWDQRVLKGVYLLRPCLSPTSPVGPIGSDPESDGQVHGNRCEGFGEVIDQRPEEDAKCLRFTRLRIRSLYRNKLR